MKNTDNFQFELSPENGLVEKYRPLLPEKLISFWQEHGFGTIADGYLKIVNPDDLEPSLREIYSPVYKNPIVMFATGLSDLIIWENNYTILLDPRHGTSKVLESGFEYFFEDINDADYINDDLEGANYFSAKERSGPVAFDECYGYVPLLGLGGPEKVGNLQKVKMKEHISLIAQAIGKIQ
ncbi:T6SS immunity protein Tdi1 domain-containing protein [Chitinophaga niabensis]|uniref:DUF1851 domain-containing protein n=1 Tax=Chitinophaga niabensis TaxID=536979 RepID=A0A1N6G085_9BACT|nr:T6SS immunity protein Tdi1 domain-containing protein [Chitinophaga niabensis]SIO00914.1 hypothetical protein SAMN04488055_2508 [Chitinophaga niabensis]